MPTQLRQPSLAPFLSTAVFFSVSQFLSYQDKRISHGNLPHLQQRVRFAASDPSQYDASINLVDLQVSDTATYECKVKKATMATRKVVVIVQGMMRFFWAPLFQASEPSAAWPLLAWLRLLATPGLIIACLVTERPAVPMCWTEGHLSKGNDVVLKCFANGGSQPLSYKWAKISGYSHPYRAGSYHSQHSFHSELSYQESFHSSINKGEGSAGRVEKVRGLRPGGLLGLPVVPSQTGHPCERLLSGHVQAAAVEGRREVHMEYQSKAAWVIWREHTSKGELALSPG